MNKMGFPPLTSLKGYKLPGKTFSGRNIATESYSQYKIPQLEEIPSHNFIIAEMENLQIESNFSIIMYNN